MDRQSLLAAYRATRALSLELCRPLEPEDFRIQSMPDVSPPWWNLGHTSWFFAKNILEPFGRYRADDARLEYALNSYYESLGPRLARDHRGLVTRPTTGEVYAFRASVDERLEALIREASAGDLERLRFLTFTGIQHEQQHQELLVTEIKHILGANVPELREPYLDGRRPGGPAPSSPAPLRLVPFASGLQEFGNLEGGWCWDNEMPVHKAWLDDYALADRLVTNGEYLEFIAAGGYGDPLLWLANGWGRARDAGWSAPLYWERGAEDGRWRQWTLAGVRDLDLDEPVCHVSFYEADAFARWRARAGGPWTGARLPTEREWEHAARTSGFPGEPANFLDPRVLHPMAARAANGRPRSPAGTGGPLAQMGGDLWEWTTNHYEPYPGYRPFDGALMEYNGKFMDNQRVLRGGSCATPADHIRPSYRNFWPPDTRFQFTGIRLAASPATPA
ncbi:MAG: ergothioneine biosynthesis protein EgtB [Acidobacteria bacterium]|nr:ergothioneine biosynthesis protein EgtB [Acidobacteriota bacterium]